MNASQGVVITGLGAITPSGQNPETLWQSVRSGTSAIDVLAGEQFDDLAVRIGGQVKDFDAEAAEATLTAALNRGATANAQGSNRSERLLHHVRLHT